MKTAEQIAADVVSALDLAGHSLNSAFTSGWLEGDDIPNMIVRAITADRAQHAADLEVLANAASHWATELTDYVIDGSREVGDFESAEAQEVERDQIEVALGRYLDQKDDSSASTESGETHPAPLARCVSDALADRYGDDDETVMWARDPENEQELWDTYVGPMLDDIREEH